MPQNEVTGTVPPELQTVLGGLQAAVLDDTPCEPPLTGVDWQQVRAIARRHQVTPLVYEAFSAAEVPDSVYKQLEQDVRENAQRNLHLSSELRRLVTIFDEVGIPALPYKGPVLAMREYGSLHRRMFFDIDLLVPPTEILRAGQLLQRNGYRPSEEFETLRTLGREAPLFGDLVECTFVHRSTDTVVDLRWKLGVWGNTLDVSFTELFQRRSTVSVTGRRMPCLSTADQLVILATHGTKHAWRRLSWLVDIALLLQSHPDLDWETVHLRAASWGAKIPLYVALILATTLFDVRVPASVRTRAYAHSRAVVLAQRTLNCFVRDPLWNPGTLEEARYNILATDTALGIAHVTVKKTLQPRRDDYMAISLPRPLWPLYLFIRVLRTVAVIAQRLRSSYR